MAEYIDPNSKDAPQTLTNYPKPISPPLPAISKHIEQSRAMSASSRSSLFSLCRSDILFEDQWLMAVNKPQGVYCETILLSVSRMLDDSDGHGNGLTCVLLCVSFCGSLLILWKNWWGLEDSEVLTNSCEVLFGSKMDDMHMVSLGKRIIWTWSLHLANRLDRDTSGVMVITKSHQVAAKLMKAFSDRKVTKTYLALCIGAAPTWEKITIKSGHGRSKFGAWRVYAASDVGRALPNAPAIKDMVTSFEVLSVNGQGNVKELPESRKADETVLVVEERSVIDSNARQDEILVRAFPRSGRTHQIRLHCQYLGISIRGDVKYEGVHEWKGKIYDGHELHAESLSFEHPVTGVDVAFRAPLPSWAVQALQPSPH
ncbi:RNA pseudouridine synthase 1 [Vitis vinifera]|uniref:RNA pseudouridine synthase 1 n=1 Tax=Vitis vinifera TaxID=29760 RepID=A0A438IM42_VITVI|nr:RNA pseudouridine synthase 1 [Vitis vinifera]